MKTSSLKKIVYITVCAGMVILLALLEYFLPLKTLLPARKIPPLGEGEIRVHFLDADEGDCTVFEYADGVMIVDSGDGAFITENRLVRYLKGLRANSYTMIATHADSDHYGGFAQFIQTFGADSVYLPLIPSESGAYKRFLSAVKDSGCAVNTLKRYSVIDRFSGAYAVCISPDSSEFTDTNESSTVLFVNCGGVNFLLGGDISAKREEKLLSEYALMEGMFDSGSYRVRLEETHVLKVSHHGSAYSSSEEWLKLLKPSTAVISCGRGNSYAHPAGGTVARLAECGADVYRTDELGTIVISIKNGNYTVLE